jgi:hypothetical protein
MLDSLRCIRTATYIKEMLKEKKKSGPSNRRNRVLSGVPDAKGSMTVAGTARINGNHSETDAAKARPVQTCIAM